MLLVNKFKKQNKRKKEEDLGPQKGAKALPPSSWARYSQ